MTMTTAQPTSSFLVRADAGGPPEGWCEMSLLGGLRRHFPLPAEGHMPGFDGATGWLNSPPLTSEDLRAKVVLVDFWTYTCINWLRTLAYVRAWAEKYRGQRVGGGRRPHARVPVRAGESRTSAEPRTTLNVSYPIALDSNYEVWRAFSNRYWPAVYIADAEGRIRHHQFGEGGYDECERGIQQLLREAGAEAIGDDLVSVTPDGFEAQADWTNLRLTGDLPRLHASARALRPRAVPTPAGCHLRTARIVDAQPVGAIRGLDDREGRERAERTGWTDRVPLSRARCQSCDAWSQPGARVPFRVLVDGAPPGDARGLDVDEQGHGTVTEPRLYQLVRQRGTDHRPHHRDRLPRLPASRPTCSPSGRASRRPDRVQSRSQRTRRADHRAPPPRRSEVTTMPSADNDPTLLKPKGGL